MEGGDLVSIVSRPEELYVTASLGPDYLDLWIGLSTLVGTVLHPTYNISVHHRVTCHLLPFS